MAREGGGESPLPSLSHCSKSALRSLAKCPTKVDVLLPGLKLCFLLYVINLDPGSPTSEPSLIALVANVQIPELLLLNKYIELSLRVS